MMMPEDQTTADPVYIDGGLIVTGTIHCDDVQPLSDRQRAEVRRRAAERGSSGG